MQTVSFSDSPVDDLLAELLTLARSVFHFPAIAFAQNRRIR